TGSVGLDTMDPVSRGRILMKATLPARMFEYGVSGAALLLFTACASSRDPSPNTETASAASNANGHGEFIIRVLPTGKGARLDPILAQNGVAPHTHVFFGAENVTSTSTWSQLQNHATTAQDSKDTAAEWVPRLFFNGKPWNPGCTGSPPNMTCGSDSN